MKVIFNNYSIQNNRTITKNTNKDLGKINNNGNNSEPLSSMSVNDVCRPVFGSIYSNFFYSNIDKLGDAYGNSSMISPYEIKNIYSKLSKRNNASSTINLLLPYRKYMHKIEGLVFDNICTFPDKVNNNFNDILNCHKETSLSSLKEKQIIIIGSTDVMIEALSKSNKEKVKSIKELSLNSIEDNSFCRKTPLIQLESIGSSSEEERKILWNIYKQWYKLPSSSKDFDAFVVKYSRANHEQIAARLISTAVATIEHIVPLSRGGEDILGNCVPVSAGYNNSRQHMLLGRYEELEEDLNVRGNLQRYMDNLAKLTVNENSPFFRISSYPEKVIASLRKEKVWDVQYNKAPKTRNVKDRRCYVIYNQKTNRKSYNVSKH